MENKLIQSESLALYVCKDKCINCGVEVDLGLICRKIEKVMTIVIKKLFSDKINGKQFPVLCENCLREGVYKLTNK